MADTPCTPEDIKQAREQLKQTLQDPTCRAKLRKALETEAVTKRMKRLLGEQNGNGATHP